MKKIFLLITSLLTINTLLGQNIKQIDSLTTEMCKSLSVINDMSNKEKIESVFQTHLSNYFESIKVSTQAEADTINTRVYYRLQKNCTVFSEILNKLEENKSDWKTLNEKPSSKIKSIDYKSFLEGGNFFYKEYNGDIVNVLISNNSWTETFRDGTISKLFFIPKSGTEFDLKFIESNNETRKNLSVKGDLYNYGIYGKESDGLLVWINSNNQYLSFKLYKK